MYGRKYKIIYPALEAWMRENKISVNQFGTMLGVSNNTIYGYVHGFVEPRLSTCRAIAKITGLSLDELFKEK